MPCGGVRRPSRLVTGWSTIRGNHRTTRTTWLARRLRLPEWLPPQSAHRLSDSTGPATSVPLPPTPSQSSSSVPPNAAMALPRSNRRSDHSRVLLASNIHGVVSATRLADMTRHIDNRNRPAIRSPAHVPPTAPRHDPHLSVVDHPSGIADRPPATVDCPPAHPATTRLRSDP